MSDCELLEASQNSGCSQVRDYIQMTALVEQHVYRHNHTFDVPPSPISCTYSSPAKSTPVVFIRYSLPRKNMTFVQIHKSEGSIVVLH